VVIEDSRIGPFTAIGDGVKILRSTVEHSVIMADSSISDIPRLEDALLGKRVAVRPGTSRHGALSLMVGDDCVIELSQN
jgi:glucose-1-phosphate thymidylyltransferase